jgi:hypothetical protein
MLLNPLTSSFRRQTEAEEENDVVATLPLHTIIYDMIKTEKKPITTSEKNSREL